MADRTYPAATRAPLIALAIAAFGIGTTEFVILGLLPQVAHDLGVGLPAAGLLVSGYALGVAFGGPILAAAMLRMPARQTLLALTALFIVGNLTCALAPTYGMLMAARIVTAFTHAAFFGTGAVVASRLAAPGHNARAIALMISGLTIANVVGVPAGTFVGQLAGWRVTFLAVAAIGLIAFAGLWHLLPPVEIQRNLSKEIRALKSPAVYLTLIVSVLASASMFAFFTYITPILTQVAAVEPDQVSLVLLAIGAGLTFGNYVGAKLADWRAGPSLVAMILGVVAVLTMFSAAARTPLSAIPLTTLWGVFAFAICAMTQGIVVEAAGSSPNLSSTLNISAFNLGNAVGAGLSAAALSYGMGLTNIPLIAAGVALVAALVACGLLLRNLGRRPLS